MHDMLRELAIQKAEQDNFLMVYPNGDSHNGSDKARRVAVHYPNCEELIKGTNPNVRSFLRYSQGPIQNVSRFRLLRVFKDYKYAKDFKDFMGLTQLRYFWLLRIDARDLRQFATHNKSLQTINLSLVSFADIPNCFWDIKTLRHVFLPYWDFGPSSSADLKNLQTLRGVGVQKSWHKGLPNLPNLRELRISCNAVEHGHEAVVNLLSNLKHLIHLEISDRRINMFEMKTIPCYEHMQTLHLNEVSSMGMLAFDVDLFPVNLIDLKLDDSHLKEDPMPVLGKLKNLKKLRLSRNAYNGNKMNCLAGDFSQLKALYISNNDNLRELKIENGSLPMLGKFKVEWCSEFEFDGLHHVTTLQKFAWKWGEIRSRAEIAIRSQIKHVPSITFIHRKF